MYEPELQRQLNLANYTKAISSEKTLELSRQQTSRAGYVNALVASGQANLALMSDRLYSYSFKPGKPGVREAEGKIKEGGKGSGVGGSATKSSLARMKGVIDRGTAAGHGKAGSKSTDAQRARHSKRKEAYKAAKSGRTDAEKAKKKAAKKPKKKSAKKKKAKKKSGSRAKTPKKKAAKKKPAAKRAKKKGKAKKGRKKTMPGYISSKTKIRRMSQAEPKVSQKTKLRRASKAVPKDPKLRKQLLGR